jgi:hypothetical protein
MPGTKAAPAYIPLSISSCVVGFSLFTAWVVAGSGGLIGHALRHAIAWTGMVAIVLSAVQVRGMRLPHRLALVLVLFAGIALVGRGTPVIGLLSLTALVGVLLMDTRWQCLRPLVVSLFIFALYRFAYVSIPSVWLLADRIASVLVSFVGWTIATPLNAGVTFGGLDLLVLSFAFAFCWCWGSSEARAARVVTSTVVIVAGWFASLVVLALSPAILAAAEDTSWKDLTTQLLPWNVPIVGVLLLTLINTTISRWFVPTCSSQPTRSLWALLMPVLAILLPIVSTLSLASLDLQGKKIVFYEKGFLNWLRPQHGEGFGRLSIGMYGMLGQFLEMHGARTLISKDLSPADLEGADALVLIYPDKTWETGQLDRISKYLHDGGTVLVMGEHTIHGPDADEMPNRKPYWTGEAHARFNDVLVDSGIRVNFDSATFAVGGWLQSYEPLAHAITAGVGDTRNEFGSVIGASLNVRFPAKPILVGKYGWNDPGDEGSSAAMMGNHHYNPGERLGDIVLAAEDNVGKGRVVVFGDTSAITNGINVSVHDFNARLFAYISGRSSGPQAIWRQLIGLVLAGAVVYGFMKSSSSSRQIAVGLFIAVLFICQSITHANATLLPDGRHTNPNKLAYIDQSHLETASQESWRDDGVMGVGMCLMRDGYVALTMSDFTRERLERAAMLISVAPNRPFSSDERAILREWIENGGIFVLTVGWPERAGSEALLKDLGFWFGIDKRRPASDRDPPEPQGFFKSPYVEVDGYRAHVRFHAAWPVFAEADDARALANGANNSAIIVRRPIGKGHVVVVGDTFFATNQNLEREGGEAFDGMRENNDFWRWLIADLAGGKPWYPSAPTTQPEGGAQ